MGILNVQGVVDPRDGHCLLNVQGVVDPRDVIVYFNVQEVVDPRDGHCLLYNTLYNTLICVSLWG
jgi:hypothetical protein